MKTIEQILHDHEMKIIQTNTETVTITLQHYEDLKLQIRDQDEKYDRLAEVTYHVIENNGNYKLENEFSKFAFGNCYFSIKTGINQEIDQLRNENKKLKDELNKPMSFVEKLKYLFT